MISPFAPLRVASRREVIVSSSLTAKLYETGRSRRPNEEKELPCAPSNAGHNAHAIQKSLQNKRRQDTAHCSLLPGVLRHPCRKERSFLDLRRHILRISSAQWQHCCRQLRRPNLWRAMASKIALIIFRAQPIIKRGSPRESESRWSQRRPSVRPSVAASGFNPVVQQGVAPAARQ